MEKSDKTFTIFVVVLLAAVGLFIFSMSDNSPSFTGQATAPTQQRTHGNMQQPQQNTGTGQGQLAPDFSLTTVDGEQVSLSDYRGKKPVVLYFVATWCPNCRHDLSAVRSVYEKYKDEVEFLAVGVDIKESANQLANYQKDMGLDSLTFAPGTSQIVRNYNVRYTTSKFGIDEQGRIAFSRVGSVGESGWRQIFQSLA